MNKANHLQVARALVKLLENQFQIWKFKFGLDPLLGIFPGAGDALAAILSLYIVFVAVLHKLPFIKILRMIINIILDFLIGSVPILGDFFDFFINPNSKNMRILEEHLNKTEAIIEGEIIE